MVFASRLQSRQSDIKSRNKYANTHTFSIRHGKNWNVYCRSIYVSKNMYVYRCIRQPAYALEFSNLVGDLYHTLPKVQEGAFSEDSERCSCSWKNASTPAAVMHRVLTQRTKALYATCPAPYSDAFSMQSSQMKLMLKPNQGSYEKIMTSNFMQR